MKKISAILLAGCMLVLVAGCAFKGADNAGSDKSENNSVVEQYVEESLNDERVQQMFKELESGGLSINMYADGSNIVYDYKYTSELSDEESEALKEQLKGSEEMLKSSADLIRNEQPAVEKVIYNHYNKDGVLIFSIEV